MTKAIPSDSREVESAGDEGPSLDWACHPVKRKPLVSVAVSVFIILVAITIYLSTLSTMFTLLGLVILAASLAKFYFPTSYRLTDKRLTISTTTQTLHKEWSIYRSCYRDKNGLLLSPFAEPSRLENFRGLYLMFNDNGDEVVAFVEARLNRDHETASEQEPAAGDNA